ncbi:MAG TPA: copper resistance protein CopC [Jatrophihabitans sp.]|nr:copper resistance protein CopC [Jatrophihabitans sp.]
MNHRLMALLALLAGLLGTALLLAGPASAHATLLGSTPADGARLSAAPPAVTLEFDEPVGLVGVGYLHVTDQHGARVDAGPAFHPHGDATKVVDKLRSGLGAGTYTASWRVVSADSHPVAGTIRFVVGSGPLLGGTGSTAAGSATNPVTGAVFDVVRWVSYGGIALLGGAWLVLTVWPAGRDDRRARALIWTGWVAAVAGAAGELWLQGPYADGAGLAKLASWTLLDTTLHSHYGQLHCARLVLLGLLALLFARSLQADARPAGWEAVAAALAIGVAWTFSAVGHPSTTPPSGLSIGLDMAHLLAMSAWLGGLALLAVAVVPRREPDELRAVLPVFSRAAFVCVTTLAITGTYAAWRGIGSLDAILTTTYGLLVLGKVALFAGLLALGNLSRALVQRRFAAPRIAYAMTDAAAEEDDQANGDEDALAQQLDTERLRRSVAVETGIGLIVLVLTAVLVAEPRGAEALTARYQQPVTVSAPLGSGRTLTVTSSHGVAGPVTLTVTEAGGPAPRRVTATATQQQAQLGPIPVQLHATGARSWTGRANLPVAGDWRIDLVATTSALDATTTDATLHLH